MLESYKDVTVSNGTHKIEDLARAFYEPICALCFESLEQHNAKAYKICIAIQHDLEQIHKFYDCISWFNLNKEEPEEFIAVISNVFDALDIYMLQKVIISALLKVTVHVSAFGLYPMMRSVMIKEFLYILGNILILGFFIFLGLFGVLFL